MTRQLPLPMPALGAGRLIRVGRADPLVVALANRHYSRLRPYTAVGSPARSLVLRDAAGACAFVWTWPRAGYRRDGQSDDGVSANCELFRNEGPDRSSDLILEAEAVLRATWPPVRRLFTYVDPARVRSPNPGYCFLAAGWQRVGASASGKILLEKALAP